MSCVGRTPVRDVHAVRTNGTAGGKFTYPVTISRGEWEKVLSGTLSFFSMAFSTPSLSPLDVLVTKCKVEVWLIIWDWLAQEIHNNHKFSARLKNNSKGLKARGIK